jgi:hypothetical protein
MEHGLDVDGHENSLSALTRPTAEVVAIGSADVNVELLFAASNPRKDHPSTNTQVLLHDLEIGQGSVGVSDGVDFHPGDQPFFVPEQDAEGSCTVGDTNLVDAEGKRTFDIIWKPLNISYDLDVKALWAEFLRLGLAALKLCLQHGRQVASVLHDLPEDGLLRIGRLFHVLSLKS